LLALLSSGEIVPTLGLGPDEPHEFIVRWIEKGYLVGRGRRNTEVFVFRIPFDDLHRRGLIEKGKRSLLGRAAIETKKLGYAVEFLPPEGAEAIRRESRRLSSLMSRMSLNLPCFGHWIPAPYWDAFTKAKELAEKRGFLSRERILAFAEEQRAYFESGGLEESVRQIVQRMHRDEIIEADHEEQVLHHLRSLVDQAMAFRTPNIIAEAIEFRTARQQWSPCDQTDMPYRQLMVDLVQATFGTTYRTGMWPQHPRSIPGHNIVRSIQERLEAKGHAVDGNTSLELLRLSATWENTSRDFAEVVQEFRHFVPDDLDFEPLSEQAIKKLSDELMDSEDEE
jgi:hypothetical protein